MQATPLSEDETTVQPKAFMTEKQIPQQRIAEALDRLSSSKKRLNQQTFSDGEGFSLTSTGFWEQRTFLQIL